MRKKAVAFKEAEGLPANLQAKELAKEKSKKSVEVNPYSKVLFTQLNGKILKVVVSSKGAQSIYVGSASKHKKQFDAQRKIWEQDGSWVGADMFEEKCAEIRQELAAAEARAK